MSFQRLGMRYREKKNREEKEKAIQRYIIKLANSVGDLFLIQWNFLRKLVKSTSEMFLWRKREENIYPMVLILG